MDEYVIKQKIQNAYFEPRAPQELVDNVILRAQAVTMGMEAQKKLETAAAENVSQLASYALIGQLAMVTELPRGIAPEELANQLAQEPAFQAALRGGNVAGRIKSGELMQQVAGHESVPEQEISVPIKDGPVMG